jgi:sugar (pentulose or hexulose) kinase
VSARFGADLETLGREAEQCAPRTVLVYPLLGTGDYFPRWAPTARGFQLGEGTRAEVYRGTLEGVAAMEALAYRRFESLGADVGDEVSALGGAVRSRLWTVIRASVQGRAVRVLDQPETAVGAAVQGFAALGHDRDEVADALSAASHVVEPDPDLASAYDGFVDWYSEVLEERAPAD